MKVTISENDTCEIEIGSFINVYGGEAWVDDFEIREYGIQLGDLSLCELTPEEYKSLGIQIINHLMSNGHNFEIRNDRNGNGEYLTEV